MKTLPLSAGLEASEGGHVPRSKMKESQEWHPGGGLIQCLYDVTCPMGRWTPPRRTHEALNSSIPALCPASRPTDPRKACTMEPTVHPGHCFWTRLPTETLQLGWGNGQGASHRDRFCEYKGSGPKNSGPGKSMAGRPQSPGPCPPCPHHEQEG